MEHLKDFDIFIKTVESKVEESYKITNENIKKGFNTHFIDSEDSFILKTPKIDKKEDEEKNTLSRYFPHNEYLSIIDLLDSINKKTNFLSSFQHLNKSSRKQDNKLFLASILGYGCNLSLSKIGKISKGINENQLENTKTWYFTEENTQEANNIIVNYMDKLEIVKYMKYNINDNHTSSDTHGYTEIVFGLIDILGFNFGPRIKNFNNQQLYAFNTPKHYTLS